MRTDALCTTFSLIYVERKRRKVANSFSFSSAGYVTSCGCMFNLFDGSRQREEYGPLAPRHHPTAPTPDTETLTITHASECKLPEAVNHFEKIPDSPRAPSLRVCLRYPFPPPFSLSPPLSPPSSPFSTSSSRVVLVQSSYLLLV